MNWKEKTAYQIYPKSFMDSNGDGIGDLQGIIRKLDYLQKLGIGILWLSPIYASPMVDQGYDISDYYAINPIFGDMEDMKELLREAGKRDITILMDLVVNHCSSQHRWFREAMKDPFGKYGRYFYIKEGKDGKAPNNWRAVFGGSTWEKIPGRENLFYYHTYAKEQPDLNWENPELREEIYQMVNWWLDQGIGGFRIDAICNIKKDLTWQDYPADGPDGMASVMKAVDHAKGIGEFLNELKERCFIPHDAFTVGEVTDFSPESIRAYVGPDGYFSTMFDLEQFYMVARGPHWIDWAPFSCSDWKRQVFASQAYMQQMAYPAMALENHDQPRAASRCIPEEDYGYESVTALGTAYFFLYGIPFIFQGEELGMRNIVMEDVSEYDDLSTINDYYIALDRGCSKKEALQICYTYARDNARTPMQWTDETEAGFTLGTPWLKVNPLCSKINVKAQEEAEHSPLKHYRRMIALRNEESRKEALVYGKLQQLFEDSEQLFAYDRTGENGQTVRVIVNFSNKACEIPAKEAAGEILLDNLEDLSETDGNGRIVLKAYQALVIERNR